MHRYIPVLAKNAGFTKIDEKVVQHQARKYGVTKFGMSRFVNGFLDLITISFLSKFGKRPMHIFGLLGRFMFAFGLISAFYIGFLKTIYIYIRKIKSEFCLTTRNNYTLYSPQCFRLFAFCMIPERLIG